MTNKYNGKKRMISNDEQSVKNAKNKFLSPVRLPFRHTGNID
jgi:hypothetical protein